MKTVLKVLGMCFFFSGSVVQGALGPFGFLVDKDWETTQTFGKQVEKSIEDLEKKRNESDQLQTEYKTALDGVQKSLAGYKERLRKVRGVEYTFVNSLVAIAQKTVHVLQELIQVHQEYKKDIENHIKLLQEYKIDPEFKLKGFQVPLKSVYSIDDLQKIMDAILHADSELHGFEERLKKISLDSEALEKNRLLMVQEYEDKKREQKLLKSNEGTEEGPESRGLSIKQRGAILDAEVRLIEYRKDLAELKAKEADARSHVVQQYIKIIKIQLEILKGEGDRIKQELRVERKDLLASTRALEAAVNESNRIQDNFAKKIDALYLLRKSELDEIATLKRRYSLSEQDTDAIFNWTYEPRTVGQWQALIAIGQRHNQSTFEVETHKDLWLARIEQEKAKVTELEVNNAITRTWYTLTTHATKLDEQQELVKERKRYESMKADIQGTISTLTDKRTTASQLLISNKRLADVISGYLQRFKQQEQGLFKDKQEMYSSLGQILKEKIALDTDKRAEVIAQLIDVYSTTIARLKLASNKVDAMIEVLNSKTNWKGAPPFWKGLKSFIPDMAKFVHYVFFEYQLSKSLTRIKHSIAPSIVSFSFIVKSILYAFLLWLVYTVIKLYIPLCVAFIERNTPHEYKVLTTFGKGMKGLLLFLLKHLKGLLVWFLLFMGVKFHVIDTYIGVLLCLLSIPVWIFYARALITSLKRSHSVRDSVAVSGQYKENFFFWLSFLSYVTVFFLFLREAILLAFPKSDASRILVAFNFILLQIALIFMSGREEILHFIPRTKGFWNWLYEFLHTYYYPFLATLVFIILMSNPYIGYGPQFFYVITRCVLIVVVIAVFVGLHTYIKNVSRSLFFEQEDEVLKERFTYGKTYYGLFIIISFLFLTAVAFIIAANIWGYSLGYEKITSWLHAELYGFESKGTGRYIGVNTLDLIRAFFYYVLGGVVFAYVVNKFVLRRMFDLLLVNVGVQSAMLTFSRTIIILTGVVIGVQSVGLDGSLFYIFALLGGLGVASKEIITDFIGYFVILIQRPVRIGDFVKIDAELMGIVRHLTVRSIIIRKNNSVTLVIPNSYLLTRPITSWNYSRTYFAFEDMFLTVMYSSNPTHVKKLILGVLESNIHILKNPPPVVRLHDFIENGFQFMVRGYLSPDKVLQQFDIVSDIRLELVETLRSHGYDLGSPTRLLRVVEDKLLAEDSPKELPATSQESVEK